MDFTPKSWKMFAAFLLFCLPCVLSQRCPKGTDLLLTTGKCMATLDDYKKMSLDGNLNWNNRHLACSAYDESVACVEKYVEACRRLELDDLPPVQLVLDDLKDGFGKLCKNKGYFERYSSHTVCYQNVQSETSLCREKIEDIFTADPSESICDIIMETHDCIIQAILNSQYAACSQDSADLFQDLIKHEFPSLMLPPCCPQLASKSPTIQRIKAQSNCAVQFHPCLAVFTALSGLIFLLETIYGYKLV